MLSVALKDGCILVGVLTRIGVEHDRRHQTALIYSGDKILFHFSSDIVILFSNGSVRWFHFMNDPEPLWPPIHDACHRHESFVIPSIK